MPVQILKDVQTNILATDTVWVQVCEIPASSFTANAKYLILATAAAQIASAASEARIRINHGTTPTSFTDADLVTEMGNASQDAGFHYFTIFTQPATAERVRIEASSSGTADVTVRWGSLIAINLDDVGTEDTDYRYNEVTADYTTTATFTDQALETFTPNGTDTWWVLANATVQPLDIAQNYQFRLNDSVAGALETADLEGEDVTNDRRGHILSWAGIPTNASHTFSAQFADTGVASTIHSSRIFLLKLDTFEKFAIAQAAGSDTPAASPSWTTTRTVSVTPDVTGDYVAFATAIADVGTATDSWAFRLQWDGTNDPNDATTPRIDSWDARDLAPFAIGSVRELASGAARTINFDVQRVAGTTIVVTQRTLVCFSARKAGEAAPSGHPTMARWQGVPHLALPTARLGHARR